MTAPATKHDTEPRSLPAIARRYVETLAMVAAATLLGGLVAPRWGTGPVDLLYLVPVLAAASLYGLGPGLFAAIASTLTFNFFFTEPFRTFRIAIAGDVVTVLMLLAVALVTSRLASAMRMQARIASANAARNATIAGFAGRLLSRSNPDEIAAVTCAELAALFECQAVLLADAGSGEAEPLARQPASAPLTPADFAIASWVVAHGEPGGRGLPRFGSADWLFLPVKSAARTLAALGLARDDGRAPIAEAQKELLGSLLDQTALALDRAALEGEMRSVAGLRERDRLRGALLSSVGHDLRTPLTAIAATAAELRRAPGGADADLLASLESETETLGRYITNLLDMARIEAGAIRIRCEPIDLVDAVSAATRDLKRRLADRELEVSLPADLPLVRADPDLLHHVLINILANAAVHGAAGTPIAIGAVRRADGAVALSIDDEGPGLGENSDRAFDTFSRIAGSDRQGGSGVGLAIVRGFADAMGIATEARNRDDRKGATFTLVFPDELIWQEAIEADVEHGT